MYVVRITNGTTVTPIQDAKHKLSSGTVVQGINTIDSFQFSVLTNNPAFGNLHDFKTLVEVFNTAKNRSEFFGRVLCSKPSMNESGLITQEATCESFFGFLCDSQQAYVEEKRWNAKSLAQHIIDTHNAQVEPYKRFVLVVDDSIAGTITNCGIQRENTWETFKKKLIESVGGEIVLSVVDGVNYITYCKKAGETKTTEIALSRNMKSITKEKDPSSFITRLIPLGAKVGDDSEERVEIDITADKEIAGLGTTYKVYAKKNYIDDLNAIAEYGLHIGYAEFDNVTLPANVLQRGIQWLATNNKVLVKYSITALDLSLINLDIDDFQVYNYHPIKNKLLNIDDTARITKKTIDVCEEAKSTFEIGESFKSLSEIQREEKKNSVALNAKIQNIEKNTAENFNSVTQQLQELTNLQNKVKELEERLGELESNGDNTGGDSSGGENTCQHQDADDDGICDICGEPFTDGDDTNGENTCQHQDADYDGICDICGEPYYEYVEIWGAPDEDDSKFESKEYDDGLLTTLWNVDCPYLYWKQYNNPPGTVENYEGGTLTIPDDYTFPILIETQDPILSVTLTFFNDIDDAFVEEYIRVFRKDGTEVECYYEITDGALRLYYPGDFDNPCDMKISLGDNETNEKVKSMVIETVD